ncbi:MAG: hypothetical protein PHV05_13535 [Candidatus Riflebacteria bacterium]|nr:hypothetical protein [Candidatus Riflebacteria bacterium]
MHKKHLPLCLLIASFFAGNLMAQQPTAQQPVKTQPQKTASGTAKVDPTAMSNQMMLVFMERMKAGNLKEAREIAAEMVYDHEKFQNTDAKEYKSFHSAMEKELYTLLETRSGSKKEIVWLEQPISDGFYFMAILDFQENKHEDALANIQKAIYWNPMRSAFYTERGFMFLRKNTGPDILSAQIAYQKALELADNAEDFAAALRGLAFVLVEKKDLDQALACLMVSKSYDSSNNDADEEMLFIKRLNPDLFSSMTFAKAKEVMQANKIIFEYAPDHVQVLIKLADNMPAASADKAVMLLKKAQEMAPQNTEITKRLKTLEKK